MTDWKELVEQCAPMVIAISWRILGNAADVEDNVQDVFLEACRIQVRTRVRHWPGLLRHLATMGALAKRRRRRRHIPLAEAAPVDKRRPSPEQSAICREEEVSLRDAVAALPEREGAAFALRYFDNLELPEIAQCLGISYSAAGAALCRARAKLTRAFAEPDTETKHDAKTNKAARSAKLGRAQPGLA